MKEWDVMFLCETWIDKKEWERVNIVERICMGDNELTERIKKGGLWGGLCVRIRVGIRIKKRTEEEKEGLMIVKVWLRKEEWRLVYDIC